MNRRFFHWPTFATSVLIVMLVSWLAMGAFGLGFWTAAAIVVFAVLINGIVATIENDPIDGSPEKKSAKGQD